MKVKYSCDQCGLDEVTCDVPERPADEDVVHWVSQTMGHCLAADHRARSPRCRATSLTKVMIPVPAGTQRVGEPPLS